MRQITVRYHKEAGTWWAESPDIAGLSVAADTREELATLVREGVAFALDDAPHMILEAAWAGNANGVQSTRSAPASVPVNPRFGYQPRRTLSSLTTNPPLALA